MDGCNWACELTQYLWKKGWLPVLVYKKQSTVENTRALQVASLIINGQLKYMAASAPLK